jgi:hypothetical protein
MKNLNDLNEYLFTALERLNNSELKGKKLETEIKRAQSVGNVANQIIGSYALQIKAESMRNGTPALPKSNRGEIIIPIEDLNKPREIRDANYYKR